MSLKDIEIVIDQLSRASDYLQEMSDTINPTTGEQLVAAYGIRFNTMEEESVNAGMLWFQRNLPVGIQIYIMNGHMYYPVKNKSTIIGWHAYLMKA